MLLSWNLALRLPLLVLPGLLALCRLLSPLLRSTVRGALSLGLLALLRSRWNNTLTAAPAAGWEWERIPAVPIVAVRVAAAVAVVPTAVALPEVHFEVPGSVPIAAGQAGARGTGQVEAASTAAASLAQAAAEQLVPEWVEQRVPVRLVPG